MLVKDFKDRFLMLSKDEQETTILKMSEAEPDQFTKGIKFSKEKCIEVFQALIQWCIDNKKQ